MMTSIEGHRVFVSQSSSRPVKRGSIMSTSNTSGGELASSSSAACPSSAVVTTMPFAETSLARLLRCECSSCATSTRIRPSAPCTDGASFDLRVPPRETVVTGPRR